MKDERYGEEKLKYAKHLNPKKINKKKKVELMKTYKEFKKILNENKLTRYMKSR